MKLVYLQTVLTMVSEYTLILMHKCHNPQVNYLTKLEEYLTLI
jgi:hypothetical protein